MEGTMSEYLADDLDSYASKLWLNDVHTLDDLLRAIRIAGPAAYDDSDGDYTSLPTWGPETARVHDLINSSGPDGDIVSWDTRDPDISKHRYLRRSWCPGDRVSQHWTIQTEADYE